MQKNKSLPIVWYLTAGDLPTSDNRAQCIKRLSDAVAEWEEDGERTLNYLRAIIDNILAECKNETEEKSQV
jgi:hypothetical protein